MAAVLFSLEEVMGYERADSGIVFCLSYLLGDVAAVLAMIRCFKCRNTHGASAGTRHLRPVGHRRGFLSVAFNGFCWNAQVLSASSQETSCDPSWAA